MHETTEQIRNFLQFITLQFIQHPKDAEIRVAEAVDDRIRFRLILHPADVAILIGRNGFTASAIRNVLKAAAVRDNLHATLQIVSLEEEKQRIEAVKAGQNIESEYEEPTRDEDDDLKLEED